MLGFQLPVKEENKERIERFLVNKQHVEMEPFFQHLREVVIGFEEDIFFDAISEEMTNGIDSFFN